MSVPIQNLMKQKDLCRIGVSNSNILLSSVQLERDIFSCNEISKKKVIQQEMSDEEKNQIKFIDNTKKCRDSYFTFRIEISLRKPRKIRLKIILRILSLISATGEQWLKRFCLQIQLSDSYSACLSCVILYLITSTEKSYKMIGRLGYF